jgi:protein TonB
MTPADTKLAPAPRIDPSDRLGAVVPVSASRVLEGADLTNVIVLSRRRSATDIEAPAVKISDTERPAPWPPWPDRVPWTALIAGVLLLHLAIVAIFLRDPAPMQSLALDSISVDIVLGGQTEAGVAQLPSPAESAPSPPAESPPEPVEPEIPTEIVEQVKPELRPRLEDAREPPREQPKREEPAEPAAAVAAEADPTPVPDEPEPTPAVAEAQPTPSPAEPEQPNPVASQPPPPKEEPTEKPREQSKPTPPRVAASRSGVGLGSSREVRDWASRISAHLARNKRYPGDALARGIGGTAVVAFTVDAGGNVGAVRLVRSSGNASLDSESRDLVRRAAPFPAPPQGKASITVPVNFNVRTGP